MHLDLLVLLVVSVGCLGSGLWIAYRGLHPRRPAEAAASMPQGALVFDPDGLEHGVACSLLLHLGILSLLLIVGPISSGTRAVPVGNTTALPGNFHVFLASLPEERKRSRLQTAAPEPVLPPHRVSVASGFAQVDMMTPYPGVPQARSSRRASRNPRGQRVRTRSRSHNPSVS